MSGVRHQKSAVKNQAANGKAKRMHKTVMNMVRCMLFAPGLALSFWEDAAEYATYKLNRNPTRANSDRKSPLEVHRMFPIMTKFESGSKYSEMYQENGTRVDQIDQGT
ncbi:unnamed protein product [Phytophthora fragariaefolia]|uniref:Unnamed protein product n=1 Tax=Phytophthora fragariaefolia TaxID=1490495 RepID=A0A9W7D634_9STRA|nr:unnamed protein product [Phytophthora fragariaefolia]